MNPYHQHPMYPMPPQAMDTMHDDRQQLPGGFFFPTQSGGYDQGGYFPGQPGGYFPGQPGGFDQTERRLDRLEQVVERQQRQIRRLQRQVNRLDNRVDRIERRLGGY